MAMSVPLSLASYFVAVVHVLAIRRDQFGASSPTLWPCCSLCLQWYNCVLFSPGLILSDLDKGPSSRKLSLTSPAPPLGGLVPLLDPQNSVLLPLLRMSPCM